MLKLLLLTEIINFNTDHNDTIQNDYVTVEIYRVEMYLFLNTTPSLLPNIITHKCIINHSLQNNLSLLLIP